VNRAEELLPPDEQARLEVCAQEPIHVPGSIQAHGVLLAVDLSTLEILQLSANVVQVFGASPGSLLGRHLAELVGASCTQALVAVLNGHPEASNPVAVQVAGRWWDAVAHVTDGLGILELEASPVTPEPATSGPHALVPALHAALDELARAASIDELRAEAARQVRRLTGFERVMVYHFHPDGHGEVVAEDRAKGAASYLNLHYPASDIPQQARAIAVRQLSRFILAGEEASPLVPATHPRTGAPLDLSCSQLRSVSSHHLEFMRNMGLRSSMSLSLVARGELVGMISCGDRELRHTPYLVRRSCEVLAQQLALRTAALAETDRLTRALEGRRTRTSLVEQMIGRDDAAAALTDGAVTLLDVLEADGAVVCLDQRLMSVGTPPPTAEVSALAERWLADADADALSPLVSDALSYDVPHLAEVVPSAAGAVLVPFGGDGDYLAWFRREVTQTVDWVGDQSADNRPTPLSPRHSFDLWRQTVSGRSLPWDEVAVQEAVELRRDIDTVLLRRAEARLAHLGLHDALTGLPNRRLLTDRLAHALERHARGAPVAVLFVDLDRFKLVNDSFGHDVGDQLVIKAGHRLQHVTRGADTVARLGGDEFLVLCEDTDTAGADLLAERIIDAFQQPFSVDGRELRVTASVGVTTAQAHHTPADLLREADGAMYLAKGRGRNRVSRFEAGMRYQALRRLDTEQALRAGFARGELTVHYQSIVDLADGATRGVEALLRWERPGHGLVSPDEFIPLAEDTGLIVPVGAWVLDEALRQLHSWKREGTVSRDFYVSVNLSPRQLVDQGLVETTRRLLLEHSAAAAELVFEITETTLMSERSMMTDAVSALADSGVSLSIDDFGTGYSSLAYLRYLPVRQLKVDRSFVRGLPGDRRDAALVAAVVGLAHQFGMTCVAEGVENENQLGYLRRLGCDMAQGYHLRRPLPAAAWARAAACPEPS
jgi:chemotaxis family two-component system sensor kinase Cph1